MSLKYEPASEPLHFSVRSEQARARRCTLHPTCETKREEVCVSECECERESVCVYEREREFVCVSDAAQIDAASRPAQDRLFNGFDVNQRTPDSGERQDESGA